MGSHDRRIFTILTIQLKFTCDIRIYWKLGTCVEYIVFNQNPMNVCTF